MVFFGSLFPFCFITYLDQELTLPKQSLYEELTFNVEDIGVDRGSEILPNLTESPIRVQTEGPESLQGIFWLTDQGDGSSLMSFAKSNEGGELNTGAFDADADAEYIYRMRVPGDRNWSFASGTGRNYNIAVDHDLVYNFELTAGTLELPTGLKIVASRRTRLDCRRYFLKGCTFRRLEVTMILAAGTTLPDDSNYPGSVVWRRKTRVLGPVGRRLSYNLIQVVDGEGYRIEPAYSKWVENQNSDAAGGTPGVNAYRKLTKEVIEEEDRICTE